MNMIMEKYPEVECDAWENGGEIPIEFTAPKGANKQPEGSPQPENKQPHFSFKNIPEGTKQIALVVHDVLDGEPDKTGQRPGWTHYTALFSPDGKLQKEGKMDAGEEGWVGPYPSENGEYHATAYFLGEVFPKEMEITRTNILAVFEEHKLGSANIVGRYTNPKSIPK